MNTTPHFRRKIIYKGLEIKQHSEHRFYVKRFCDRGIVMFTSEAKAKAYIEKHLSF